METCCHQTVKRQIQGMKRESIESESLHSGDSPYYHKIS